MSRLPPPDSQDDKTTKSADELELTDLRQRESAFAVSQGANQPKARSWIAVDRCS